MITEAPKGDLVVSTCILSNRHGEPPVIGWATYRQDGAVLSRVKSVKLPTRPTRQEAERDLLVWLTRRVFLTGTAAERLALYPAYLRMQAAVRTQKEATP
mgnify:CR=1 FL=1